ncbi:hypothetical protein V493_07592, partial [Pseudogymnoascus sp. VKM F-4281 (FW-2241)]
MSTTSSSPPPTKPAPAQSPIPLPVDGPFPSKHNRSTSLTSLRRTFSKILPANRSERGGTLRDSRERGDVVDTVAVEDARKEGEQRRGEKESEKGEGKRARSWSPRKGDVMGSFEHEEEGERGQEVEKE